jgi:rhodanese-related sulfurtransferase
MKIVSFELHTDLLPKAFSQATALLVLAVLLSLGVNQLRPDGLALVQDWSAQARLATPSGQSMVIEVEQAAALHRAGQAVFVDARPVSLFVEGHIAGALNVPWQQVNDHIDDFLGKMPDAATPIITYCDGEACELSEDLAKMLNDMGYKNVKVLVNGWTLWVQHGHPTAKGENHGA